MRQEGKPPFPPLDLANRVSSLPDGPDAMNHYEWLGLMASQSINAALPDDWTWEGKRLLDFGCGAGRTLRHFLDVSGKAEVWGCDIDAPSIEWMQENLCPPLNAVTCREEPPLEFESGSFDLIWAVSVFTHLAETSAEWMLEMHRLLKPEGILIASFMGRLTHEPLTGQPWDESGTGIKVIGLDNPWDLGGPSVFMSDWWVREHWGRAFEVEIIDAGVETLNQSWAVMRRKPVDLTAGELFEEKPRRWWRR
ncbi:MAG: class I SAM-dependent methyltransferase [Solirubrobacterales bacterium]|nr:class I SAM-dependent methyltransferase [Solirubrobacterales bacterium]MCB0859812.1 class I SAM-dependent methyltransferase [Solirubrobacterales bacterium]HRV59941.1 class I SAM-dependent methyltransferase [Solirubrobacterales bacterium]